MSRFGFLVSTVPLVLIALLARGEGPGGGVPCVAVGDQAVRLTAAPAQAALRVAFTDDPARATLRVQIVDHAEDADFALSDDDAAADDGACALAAQTRLVAITATAQSGDPVIRLSREGGADYRVFVASRRVTPRQAAALIVAASDRDAAITTASIGGGS